MSTMGDVTKRINVLLQRNDIAERNVSLISGHQYEYSA